MCWADEVCLRRQDSYRPSLSFVTATFIHSSQGCAQETMTAAPSMLPDSSHDANALRQVAKVNVAAKEHDATGHEPSEPVSNLFMYSTASSTLCVPETVKTSLQRYKRESMTTAIRMSVSHGAQTTKKVINKISATMCLPDERWSKSMSPSPCWTQRILPRRSVANS